MAEKLNPLRVDPTRTTMLRKKFLSDMGRRFRGLRGSIRDLVVVEDAFGLKQRRQNAVVATQAASYRTLDTDVVLNTRWQFETDDAKVDDYRAWLTSQVQAGILQVSDDNQATPWLEPYIRSAYKQGLLRAYHDTTGISTAASKDWSFIEGGKAAFMDMAFNSPESEAKIRLLATRAYSQLEGVTASMDAEMSRILATGLANGSGSGEIGKQLNDSVSKLQRTRANTIARTETTYAHSEGQLDSFALMNVEEVGVMAEWNTAHDGKVCAICRPLEGVVMTIDEARSLIPRHPNCRCAWLPASVGEQSGGTTKSVWLDGGTTGQVYAKDEVDTRIRKSLKAEKPGLSTKDARAASTWTGADVKVSKKKKPKATDLKKEIAELKKQLARKQAATRAAKIKAAKRELPGTPEFFEDSVATIQAIDVSPWETGGLPGWGETGIYYTEHDKNLQAAYLAGESADTIMFEEVVWGNTDISIDGIRAANTMPKSKQQFAAKVYKKDGGFYPVDDDAANAIAAQWARHGPDGMLNVQVFDLDAVEQAKAIAAQAQQEALEAKLVEFGVDKAALKFGGKLDEDGNYPKMQVGKLGMKLDSMLPDDIPAAKQAEIFEYAAYDIPGGFDAQLKYVQTEAAAWQETKQAAEKAAALLEEVGLQKQKQAANFLSKTVPGTDPKQAAFIDAGWEKFQEMPGWQKPSSGLSQSYGVILFDNKGRILLRKPKGGFGGANWTFAKGGGSHKLPATTALAELGEETGYTANLVSAMPNAYKGQTTKTNFFIGKTKDGGYDPSLMDAETEAVQFMSYAEAHTAIMQSPDPKVRARDMAILNDAYDEAGLLAEKPLGSMGDLQLFDVVNEGKAILTAQEKAAAKAAQSYKVKLGMSKKHYAKPKFGGGVVPKDFDNPDKLATSGINKVLSEKGWHIQTLPDGPKAELANATNIVEQKAVIDKLKKAPKGTKKIPLGDEAVQAPTGPAAVATDAVKPQMKDLKYVQSLAGSTKPYKAKHATTGEHWVVKSLDKSNMTEAHMRSEALVDELYRAAGFDVPESMIIEDTTGPAKVSRWIENGTTLEDWKRGKTTAEVEAMYEQISEGFVADALFANHDVAGMSYDNIFIADGKPYRIDNGGGLLFRAQGAPKANFGAEVMELTSMRDKQYSGPNAAIFANINDDKINAQIEKLLGKKERMLGLVEDPALRATLAARFDFLEARLPKKKAPKRPRGTLRGEYEITDQTVSKIKENKSNGATLVVDKDYIEDHNVLAWQEFDADGDRQTVVSMNLTLQGDQQVKKTLGGELASTARAATPTPSGHPEDLGYFDKMLPAIKNIAYHSPGGNGDLKFNPSHVQTLKDMRVDLKKALEAAKKDTAGKPEQTVAMLRHYMQQVLTALDAVDSGEGLETGFKASAYTYIPSKKAIDKTVRETPKPNRAFRVNKFTVAPQNKAAKFKDGEIYRGRENYSPAHVEGEAYQIDAGDGIVVRYVPVKDESRERQALQALQGQVEIQIPGEVTEARLKQAMSVLKDLGIDPEPPTAVQEELLYLHRGVYLHNGHTRRAYTQIWENTDITDEEKLAQMKTYIRRNTKLTGGKDVDKMPGYDPAGVGKHAAGGGHRVFYRWDITREQMGIEMDGYTLQHTTGGLSESPMGAVESAIRGIGASGGEFTSTTGRIRKGVPLSGGDSPGSDVRTGGANYWFTRVKKEDKDTNGFFWDVRELARQDVVSYENDEYGRISSFGRRAATTDKYKQFAESSVGNESNFKEGFSWDQLDFIRVRPSEKAGVLSAFKELKMTHLPDGRPVEKIITTTRKPPDKKWRKKTWVPINGNG